MDLYENNYRKLLRLLPDLQRMNGPANLVLLGHKAVNINVVERHKHRLVLRMSHYLQRLHGPAKLCCTNPPVHWSIVARGKLTA